MSGINPPVQEAFPDTVTRPLAQIIMLDGGHGDSNIIDLCVQDLKTDGRYKAEAYQRFLIDTGPSNNEGLENIKRVIKTYKLPRVRGGHAPGETDPILKMVQLTHTDDDHCGEASRLLDALRTDTDLRKHFEKTVISFHALPSQDPGFGLRISDRGLARIGNTVECYSTNWAGLIDQLEKCNIYLQYKFTIAGVVEAGESDESTRTLTDSQLVANSVSIECAVKLWERHTITKTTRFRKFDMRTYHCQMFTAKRTFPILPPVTSQPNVNPLKRTLSITGTGGTPAKQPTTGTTTNTTGTPTNPIPSTSGTQSDTVSPPGERNRANQKFYRIAESMNQVVRRNAGLLDPTVWQPIQDQRFHVSYTLGALSIVGPTRSLYNKLIRDTMKVEYGQSPRTPGAKAAEEKAIKDKAAKDLAAKTNPTTVKPTPKELADEKTAREKAKKDKDPDMKDGEIHNMASIVSLFQRYASGTAVRPVVNRKGEPIKKERENVGESVFKMLFTGDAHDRDCTLRNTVDAFVGGKPQRVDVLKKKIPHHGSLLSTSVEFYQRIYASVYLICARQSSYGAPDIQILEAIVSQLSRNLEPAHIFFSNPDALYNIPLKDMIAGTTSNVNILLSGARGPGQQGPEGRYNYTCYILKHRVAAGATWAAGVKPEGKNAGIILLGHDINKKLIVTASPKYWDIWDEARVNSTGLQGFKAYRNLQKKPIP